MSEQSVGASAILGRALLPLARLYVRYAPFDLGKIKLLSKFLWRHHLFNVTTAHQFRVKGRSNDMVQGYIYYFGTWEPSLTQFVRNRLTGLEDRAFIDIGANIGYFSLLAARLMPSGSIHAIEAHPRIFQDLLENIRINDFKNISALNYAAVDKAGSVDIYLGDESNIGTSTIRANIHKGSKETVTGLPLSSIISADIIEKVRMIKIDVEGAEKSVVDGMDSILSRLPQDAELMVEVNPEAVSAQEIEDFFDKFSAAGFHAYLLENSYSLQSYISRSHVLEPKKMKQLPTEQVDVIFSKKDMEVLS